jgi:hypothetical protein
VEVGFVDKGSSPNEAIIIPFHAKSVIPFNASLRNLHKNQTLSLSPLSPFIKLPLGLLPCTCTFSLNSENLLSKDLSDKVLINFNEVSSAITNRRMGKRDFKGSHFFPIYRHVKAEQVNFSQIHHLSLPHPFYLISELKLTTNRILY